jgi:hypothetical protein
MTRTNVFAVSGGIMPLEPSGTMKQDVGLIPLGRRAQPKDMVLGVVVNRN